MFPVTWAAIFVIVNLLMFAYWCFFNPDTEDESTSDTNLALLFKIFFYLRAAQLSALCLKEAERRICKKTPLDTRIGDILYKLMQFLLFVNCILATILFARGEFNRDYSAMFLKVFVIVHWTFMGLLCCSPCLAFLFAECFVKIRFF